MGFIEYFQILSQGQKINVNYEVQKIVIRMTGLSMLSKIVKIVLILVSCRHPALQKTCLTLLL